MTWAILAIIAALGFGGGWTVNGWRHDSIERARIEAANRDQLRRIERQDVKAVQHEREKVVIREKFVPITETVDRIVVRYADRSCLDDDGLRVVNAAIAAAATASQPARAVPGPAAADQR